MHILITRPQESSSALQDKLQRLGHHVITDPLIHIVPRNPKIIFESLPPSFEAIVTTSQHAIICLSKIIERRDFPLWCVGIESAKVAQDLGFQNIHWAEGSAENLLTQLLINITPNSPHPIIHLSGDVIRLDIAKSLQEQGVQAQRIIVYSTQEATAFSKETKNALETSILDAVLFFSPRTAHIFQNLCQASQLEKFCHSIKAVCLSDAIKTVIGKLPWQNIQVAKKTTTDDLLIALMMAD